MKKRKNLFAVMMIVFVALFQMATYADEPIQIQTGKVLQSYQVIKGDAQGNLNESQPLTREQAIVILTRLLGKEAEAQNYKGNSFADVPTNSYYAPYLAYAKTMQWTNGLDGVKFGYGMQVSTKAFATYLLRALNYSADWSKDDIMGLANGMGIMDQVTTAENANILRGDVFVMMYNALYVPQKDTQAKLGTAIGLPDFANSMKITTASSPATPTTPVLVQPKATTAPKLVQVKTFKYNYKEFVLEFDTLLSNYNKKNFKLSVDGQVVPESMFEVSSDGKGLRFRLRVEDLHGKTIEVRYKDLANAATGDKITVEQVAYATIDDEPAPTVLRIVKKDEKSFDILFSTVVERADTTTIQLEDETGIITRNFRMTYDITSSTVSVTFINDYKPVGAVHLRFLNIRQQYNKKRMDPNTTVLVPFLGTPPSNVAPGTPVPPPTVGTPTPKPAPKPEVVEPKVVRWNPIQVKTGKLDTECRSVEIIFNTAIKPLTMNNIRLYKGNVTEKAEMQVVNHFTITNSGNIARITLTDNNKFLSESHYIIEVMDVYEATGEKKMSQPAEQEFRAVIN